MTRIGPHSPDLPQQPLQKSEAVSSLHAMPPVADVRLHATVPADRMAMVLLGLSSTDPSALQTVEVIKRISRDPVVREALVKIILEGTLGAIISGAPPAWLPGQSLRK